MVNPVAVYAVVVGKATFVNPDVALVERCTAYALIAAPPLLDGTVHDSRTLAFPAAASGERGALGTVRGTALTTVLPGPQPAALWARIRK